jgi:hypothetical protein
MAQGNVASTSGVRVERFRHPPTYATRQACLVRLHSDSSNSNSGSVSSTDSSKSDEMLWQSFLDAFLKKPLQATIGSVTSDYSSFRMSVCTYACNNSASTGRIFVKFDIKCFSKMFVHNSSYVKI